MDPREEEMYDMITDEFKDKIKRHVTDDFESSMTDSEKVPDGIGDSISAGLTEFEPEINLLSSEDQELFWDFVDDTLTDLIGQWEEEQEEEDE